MRVDCRNLQELKESVADLSHGDRIVLLTDAGAFRFRVNTNNIDFHESDEKGNLPMSETKENCPDCGHFRPHHFKSYYIYDRGCFWDDCPCTRTYESLVGEKGDGLNCPCQKWAGRADWIDGHHPNCDGHGKPKTHFVTGLSVAEPELQLLVVDCGNECYVKVEKGVMPHTSNDMMRDLGFYGQSSVVQCTFTKLREAIDGVKPLPRIEQHPQIEERHYLHYFGDGNGCMPLTAQQYDDLTEINGGKPLPIYEGGTWEMLVGEGGEIHADTGLSIWRFTR